MYEASRSLASPMTNDLEIPSFRGAGEPELRHQSLGSASDSIVPFNLKRMNSWGSRCGADCGQETRALYTRGLNKAVCACRTIKLLRRDCEIWLSWAVVWRSFVCSDFLGLNARLFGRPRSSQIFVEVVLATVASSTAKHRALDTPLLSVSWFNAAEMRTKCFNCHALLRASALQRSSYGQTQGFWPFCPL